MNHISSKQKNLQMRKHRIRAKIIGTNTRPRLSIKVSLIHISAQLIDDEKGITIASSTTIHNKSAKGTMMEKASFVGKDIASKAKKLKVSTVVLDRNGRKYHGKVKALAESARAEGLEF